MMSARIRRVAWVASHPIQYQAPVFRQLARMNELDFEVIFLSEHGMTPSVDPQFGVRFRFDVPLTEGYRWRLASGRVANTQIGRFWGVWSTGMYHDLRGFDAVVVGGWNYLGYVLAAHAARLHGSRVIHLSDSTLEERRRPLSVRLAKRAFFAGHIRRSDHALAPGARARRYLEHVGIAPQNIHAYPHTTDTELTDAAYPQRHEFRAEIRQQLGISNTSVTFVFCGKLIAQKNPLELVEAFGRVRGDAHLLFVGAGALAPAIRERCLQTPRVHLLGFRNQTELPRIYAAADVLVLPSRGETWGLVVNEAMAMGCGVIITDRVGCGEDLVQGKGTGVIVPLGDSEALAAAMQCAVDDRGTLAGWRSRARGVVASHTPEAAAMGVREAVFA